ncbi:hypothetical protein SLEP1_g6869 [Rubroshorea leprosula]|uniref:Uncharacterized protein n=1 Tax=Rubroshorea leprosula TaxID=152421 RepID=A0AAV5I7F1_9ROSI|nr:hypothetical protein SLEP1_g6869 [Rubroshorea leprosula]
MFITIQFKALHRRRVRSILAESSTSVVVERASRVETPRKLRGTELEGGCSCCCGGGWKGSNHLSTDTAAPAGWSTLGKPDGFGKQRGTEEVGDIVAGWRPDSFREQRGAEKVGGIAAGRRQDSSGQQRATEEVVGIAAGRWKLRKWVELLLVGCRKVSATSTSLALVSVLMAAQSLVGVEDPSTVEARKTLRR